MNNEEMSSAHFWECIHTYCKAFKSIINQNKIGIRIKTCRIVCNRRMQGDLKSKDCVHSWNPNVFQSFSQKAMAMDHDQNTRKPKKMAKMTINHGR